jgi:hypothetical protein
MQKGKSKIKHTPPPQPSPLRGRADLPAIGFASDEAGGEGVISTI